MEELIKSVEVLASWELERANKANDPVFHSTHEGYAVIKEEIEEAEKEIFCVNTQLSYLWDLVKSNDKEYLNKRAEDLKKYAINLAAESIQVAAMAQKFQDSFKE